MQPFFTTNDAEFSKVEGLYIKETNPPASVPSTNLNTIGVTGQCVRGPVNKAIVINSEGRFKQVFGGRDRGAGGAIQGEIWKFLLNKPVGQLVCVRAAAAGAVAASKNLADVVPTTIARLDASSVGTWGNDLTYDIVNASDGNANHWNLVVHYLGVDYTFQNINTTTGNDNTATVVGTDDGRVINLTKIADGRPINVAGASVNTVAGTDGAIADTDYTATGGPIDVLAGYKGLGVVCVATRMNSNIRTKMGGAAATVSDRLFLIGANDETVTYTSAKTDSNAINSDRVVYVFNHVYTMDPQTASEILTEPWGWLASILSQIDVDVHPGEEDTKAFTSRITRLYNESYTRNDYVSMKANGLAAFEKDNGFAIVSGVSTYIPDGTGKHEITRRRMADYLTLSVADFLKHSVKKKNLATRRQANKAAISAFLRDLAIRGKVVDVDANNNPLFVVDTESLNTPTQRAAGLEYVLMRVKLVGHMLEIVLQTEIGTGVTIQVQ